MNSRSNAQGEVPSLDSLRTGLTATQKLLLNELWQRFFDNRQWPSTRSIYSKYEKPVVRAALSPLTGSVSSEIYNNGQNELALTLLGALLTENGFSYQKLLSRFFELQHDMFRKAPEARAITSEEIGRIEPKVLLPGPGAGVVENDSLCQKYGYRGRNGSRHESNDTGTGIGKAAAAL